MRTYINRCLLIIAALLLIITCSACDFDESKYHLSGGELLDEEKMSEIKNEVLSVITFETDTEEVTDSKNDLTGDSDETVTDGQNNIDTDEITVYWTKSGSVWHTSADCYHLRKSTEILSGTVTEAQEAGKLKLCSNCGK